jgi:hypothetical protein
MGAVVVRIVGRVTGEAPLEEVDLVAGQEEAVREQLHGPAPRPSTGGRVDQHLDQGSRQAGADGGLARDRGQETAGRVAADGQPGRLVGRRAWQRARVGEYPLPRGPGVVDRGRVGVLGRQPVLHRQHRESAARAEQPARAVVGVDIAEHEPASVEEDQQVGPVRCRRVEPGPQRTGRPVDAEVGGGRDRRRLAGSGDGLAQCHRSDLVDRQGRQRGHVALFAQLQQELELGVQRQSVDDDRVTHGDPQRR